MFTLSSKSDYGLLLLTLLAGSHKNEFIPLSDIAVKSGLPKAYISRIASELANAGIIKSKEGLNGGYKLAIPPAKITIAQVTQILDGPWQPTKCTSKQKKCSLEKNCPMADNWQNRIKAKMWKIMDSYTLKDLMS
ncbi:MAG: Rrf2 family transcriptional regulator [Candidatus Gottesmanbacteria bacterium]